MNGQVYVLWREAGIPGFSGSPPFPLRTVPGGLSEIGLRHLLERGATIYLLTLDGDDLRLERITSEEETEK
jgi:hypothetical protein